MADQEPESDPSPYSPPPRSERAKRSSAGMLLALGALLLLPLIIFGYYEFPRAQPAPAPRAEAAASRVFPPLTLPAAAPSPESAAHAAPAPAPETGDRMMIAPTADERMMIAQGEEPGAPALKPTSHLDAAAPPSSTSSALQLDINNPKGEIAAIATDVDGHQVNRYAVSATPYQRLTIALPDSPGYQFVYRVLGRDGKLLAKGALLFAPGKMSRMYPLEVDPRERDAFRISATYNGPVHMSMGGQ